MTYNPYTLEQRTILVTGASSGIGRQTAIECARLGAKVIVSGRNAERLQETLDILEGEGHLVLPCDLANTDDIHELAVSLPRIDGLVSNAGYTQLQPIPFLKADTLGQLFQVNTLAPILLLKELLKERKLAKGGSVVFTSSLDGIGATTMANSAYAATKGALSAFTRAAALELAGRRIRVNAVCPGMVATHILDGTGITDEDVQADLENYPLGRYGEPRDVALAITYLLSDAAAWLTGHNLIIDGGLSLH
jgi:NAD(P)-dependent dehydrogenase (short-subunit alcohol dehydrogenase family)